MSTKYQLSILSALILVLILNLSHAQAQSFLEAQAKTNKPYKTLTFIASLSGKFSQRWGLNVFFLTTGKNGQVYAGPTLIFNDGKIVLSASFGAEQDENGFAPRYAASLFLAHGRTTFLGIAEANNGVFDGDNTGLFYDLSLKVKVNKRVAVGIKDKRPAGLGPMLQVKDRSYTYWAAYLPLTSEGLDLQPDTFLVGFRINP
jgi:hypothetical protein